MEDRSLARLGEIDHEGAQERNERALQQPAEPGPERGCQDGRPDRARVDVHERDARVPGRGFFAEQGCHRAPRRLAVENAVVLFEFEVVRKDGAFKPGRVDEDHACVRRIVQKGKEPVGEEGAGVVADRKESVEALGRLWRKGIG